MLARRKQQEDGGEHRGDQRPAGKALKDAKGDQRRKVAAGGAADRRQREDEGGDTNSQRSVSVRVSSRSAEWR